MEPTETPQSEFLALANSISIATKGTDKLISLWLRNGNHPTMNELTILQSIKEGITAPSDIARKTGQATPSVSNTLTTLTNRGLVEREKDMGDGRRRKILLTPEGETALTDAQNDIDKNFDKSYIPLDKAEMNRIRNVIEKYTAIMRFPT
jgi:DNA-binding MarR family transcriptional regulator